MAPGTFLSPVKGVAAALVLGANTLVMCLAMMPVALLKLLVPLAGVRKQADRVLNALARAWIAVNNAWIGWVNDVHWDVRGVEALDPRRWYLVSSNHQAWADIFVLQRTLHGRTPLLKFFLKRELLYVPVIGLAWWALDFPFVSRRGGVQGSKEDMESALKACNRFRAVPTAVLNFLEGTRYTAEKARAQKSPYRHLLKPKAGGLAMAMATLNDKVDGVLDVTLVYPDGVPTFWGFMCGRLGHVIVRVRVLRPPAALLQPDSARDPRFRGKVQAWLHQVWAEKDQAIDQLLNAKTEAG